MAFVEAVRRADALPNLVQEAGGGLRKHQIVYELAESPQLMRLVNPEIEFEFSYD